ncbi:GNAT family N-acetyltransferase [Paenibacillus sp. N1-5-1-14]|uniref:GNAT family N-acetyltransferase n=1 Tax=Paenibacillus radicibacter TaxID=2972488 RepID=UPI002158B5BA|nr:GNAT family N-acetyltransferase [Paenibacillus radicibacter]MCR8644459.1 GNAT family N-acetyltransferase [Paenibacillus radicibacter]
MYPNLTINRVTPQDASTAYQVFELSIADAFDKEGSGHLLSDIQSEIVHKKHLLDQALSPMGMDSDILFLVAKLNDVVVGTISYAPCGDDVKVCTNHQLDAVGEVGSMYVLPAYQDQGVGSALIQALLRHLHERGVEEFCLDSGYQQAQGRWKHKFGTPYVIVEDYWGQDSDHMVWYCKVRDYVK